MTKWVGIDISYWQGKNIDFDKLANAVDFVIIRTVVGRQYDRLAKYYINECFKHNIPYGLYCAAYPLTVNDAVEEAHKMIRYGEMCKPLYPLYYDYEGFSLDYARKKGYNHDRETIKEITRAFCNTIEKAGFYAGVYANLNYSKNIYGDAFFKRYSHWLAYWNTNNVTGAPMWQFTSNGYVDGIKTRIDKNICTKDFPGIIKAKHLNGW